MFKHIINMNLKDQDIRISISIIAPFVVLTFQFFLLYYFNLIESKTGVLIQSTSKVIIFLFFLYSLPVVLKRNYFFFIIIYSASIIIFSLNYLFYNQNILYLNKIMFQYLFNSLPFFIYSFSIKNKKALISVMNISAQITYIIGIIIGILLATNKITIGAYSMTLSYYLLFPTIIYIYKFFNKSTFKYFLIIITSIIVIILFGSRGPILSIGVYIFFYIIINFKNINLSKKYFIIFSLIILLGIRTFLNEQNSLILINTLDKYGIHSRSLYLFIQEGLHLSERNIIYEEVIYQIYNNPILGIGIAGDRYYLGTYSHNIFLEILSGFGIILGSFIILILGIIIKISLFSKNKEHANIILIWFSVGFIPLLVSGSYLTHFQFWIFLGLAIRSIVDNKKNLLS